jgi:DNA ligase D-like protein (predicted ligase)
MLAGMADPFDSEDHLFEIKWDGARVLAFVLDGRLTLQSRRLLDITYRYPELQAALPRALKRRRAVLDGELIAPGPDGRPDLKLLASREQQQDPFHIRLAAERIPVIYMAFDVLQVGERVLTGRPLAERRRVLSGLLRPSAHIVLSQGVVGGGKRFFEEAVARGLEGAMAKRLDGPYLIGRRSDLWLKIKPRKHAVFHIMGYTLGQGARALQFGSLAVGEYRAGELRYVARVGSGFSEEQLADILARLKPLETGEQERLTGGRGGPRTVRWVRPELKCRVSYFERTPKGSLRGPVFEGLVED